jgi:hypothetical protein
MYVLNVMKHFDPEKVYKCNHFIKTHLIYSCHLSVLGQAEDGNWLFSRTEKLKEALDKMPFYLKMIDNLN